MVRFSFTAPLLMVALALGIASTDARAAPRRVGNEIRSPANKINPAEIDQAIELLRRANYDFAGHLHNDLERRGKSEEKWTMWGGGYTCHCSGKGNGGGSGGSGGSSGGGGQYNNGGGNGGSGSGNNGGSGSGGNGGSGSGNNGGGNGGSGSGGNGGSGSGNNGGGSYGGGGGGGGNHGSNPPSGGGNGSNPPSGGNGQCPPNYQPARQGDVIQINDNDLIDLSGLTIDLNILNFGSDGKQSAPQTVPITDKPTCKSDTCCYKPSGDCPDGYQYVSKGNVYQENDNDLLDLSGLTVNLDILNFFKNADKTSESKPASDKPTCQSDACCVKPVGSAPPVQCPSGYTKAGNGDVIQINDNDLIDASGASVILNLLNFGSTGQLTGSSKPLAKDKPKCDADTCCYKTVPGGNGGVCPSGTVPVSQGNIIQQSDNDLLDLSDLSVVLNILNFGSNGKQTSQSTASPKDQTVCTSTTCCVSSGSGGSGSGGKPTCPSNYVPVTQGNIIQKSDNDLIDLSDLSVVLNILNFGSNGQKTGSQSAKGSDSTKCNSALCCVEPTGGSGPGSGGDKQPSCPSGYAPISQGNIIQKSDNDLLDLSDLSVVLNILNFGSNGQKTGSGSAKGSDSTKCNSALCCVKPSGGNGSGSGGDKQPTCPSGYAPVSQGNIIQKSDNDLIDLSDLSISLSILNFGSNGEKTGSGTAKGSDSTKCNSNLCCVKSTGGSGSGSNGSGSNGSDSGNKGSSGSKTCPSGYQTAHQGDVMQVSDNDGIDLKNLQIDIHILDFSKPAKTVAATSKPTCNDETCCYKASSITQVSDNDLVDGKNGKIKLCLLSSNCD